MFRDHNELERIKQSPDEVAYRLNNLLNDKTFWKPYTKGSAIFPKTVVKLQEVVETNRKNYRDWHKLLPAVLPTDDFKPEKASLFSNRKAPQRELYTAIKECSKGNEFNFKIFSERLDHIYSHYLKTKMSSLETAGLMGYVLMGL